MSVLTQKHYEFLERALREERAPRELIEILCRVLRRDNQRFRPDLFRSRAGGEGDRHDENSETGGES